MSESSPAASGQPVESAVPEKYRKFHADLLALRAFYEAAILAWLQEKPMDDLARFQERKIQVIDGVLRRIRDGTIGICERCEGEIPLARLRAVISATTCIRCRRLLNASSLLTVIKPERNDV
ncbi:MAG: TraR/DksA C4-type zinc finger protein [Candidatus Peribacteraceae bacterium]